MKKFLISLLLCGLLTGCGQPPLRGTVVVTGVEITCAQEGGQLRRVYTHPEKVRRVLHYLRRRQTAGYPEGDPERIVSSVGRVELWLSDGSRRIYRLRGGRFLSVDGRRWKKVDPAWGRRLYCLALLIPSDPVANSAVS